MGKWVHDSVHDEVSAADSERLGALKLHDAAAHCNWVKPFENPFVRRVKRRIDMRFKSRMSDTRNSHHAVQQTSNELILFRHQAPSTFKHRRRL
jgi:hypothetical protein